MIKRAVVAYLMATSSVTDLTGTTGIHATFLPEGASLPALVVTKLGASKYHTHGGPLALVEERIQVASIAKSQLQADQLAEAVSAALDDQAFRATWGGVQVRSCMTDNEVDLGFVIGPDNYQVAVDATVQYIR